MIAWLRRLFGRRGRRESNEYAAALGRQQDAILLEWIARRERTAELVSKRPR